jgi:REP element-mobilizing transposase RayT
MTSRRHRRALQQALPFRTHGGRCERPARPRPGVRRGAPHRARPAHDSHHPVHVTMRGRRRLPSLRSQTVFLGIRRALAKTPREWFRVVHFSVQTDHIHLIVEADDRVALSRGMAGLSIRLARAINRVAGRSGNVFTDRYRARFLRHAKSATAWCTSSSIFGSISAVQPGSIRRAPGFGSRAGSRRPRGSRQVGVQTSRSR